MGSFCSKNKVQSLNADDKTKIIKFVNNFITTNPSDISDNPFLTKVLEENSYKVDDKIVFVFDKNILDKIGSLTTTDISLKYQTENAETDISDFSDEN